MQLTVTSESDVSDQGSVVLVDGIREDGRHQWFAADARIAYDLVGYAQDDGEIQVQVESWQLWGGPR